MKEPTRKSDPHAGARERSLDALATQRRDGISMSAAAHRTRTTRRTILRHAGRAYERTGRRWIPRDFDRIPREMTVLTAGGPEQVVVRDSRTASLLALHANAVRSYRDLGDEERLRRLPRRQIQIDGRRVRLMVDPDVLDRLIAGAELSYELYTH